MSVVLDRRISQAKMVPAMRLSDDTGTPIDPIELYAAAIDTSDYVQRVAPLIKTCVPAIGDLLDVGAGGGQLGHAVRQPGRNWTALEPNPNMRARLERIADGPQIIAAGWKSANVPRLSYDTVLVATLGAPQVQQPGALLARCRSWSRRAIVWVVPAQSGPRGLVFAGCLPSVWHREDETPGIDITLRNLPASAKPHTIEMVEWTFTGVIADLGVLANYLSDRLGWGSEDDRRVQMAAHLAAQAKPDPGGYRLEITRKSAILIWGRLWGNNLFGSSG